MNPITTLLKTGHFAAASLLVFGLTGAGAQPAHAVDHRRWKGRGGPSQE
jgi:hypothetical protein